MYTSVVRNYAAEPCLTVYHRIPSLHLSFSTCIHMISHKLPVKNTSILAIQPLRLVITTFHKLKEFYREIWTFLVPILPTGDSSWTALKLFRVCFILLIVELTGNLTFKSPVKGYGWYASFMHRIGLSDNPNYVCDEIQTNQHVLTCQHAKR